MTSLTKGFLPAVPLFALVLALLALSSGKAADRSYAVRLLDRKLAEDAHAVVRENLTTFQAYDRRKASLRVQRVVTIFDAQGRSQGTLELPYDRFGRIKNLEGRILDQNGEEVRDLEKSDLHDVSAVSDFSLYEDSRVRTAELYYDRYPYSVEFTYEIAYEAAPAWPPWYAQEDEYAVEHNQFTVILPRGDSLRYWTNADSLRPVDLLEGGLRRYTWEVAALPRLSQDMMEEEIDMRTAIVCTAPSSFEVDDYLGDMTSWRSLGLWMAALFKGRDLLPEAAVRDVHALVSPGDSPRDKVRKLYKYMQARTRYVSVQLGIGAWQPFDASYVHARGYGDCKALSNYMIALLREAGVQAFPVIIHIGTRPTLYRSDFPSFQFNHVIACVPLGSDSLWLECTSQKAPAGHLGAATEDRCALLVRPEGGEIVRTPRSSAAENGQVRSSRVRLWFTGEVEGTITMRSSGNKADDVRYALSDVSLDEQQRWLLEHLRIPNVQLRSFATGDLKDADSCLTLSMEVTVPRYGSLSGTRIFFEPNLAERRTTIPRDIPLRRSPIRFVCPYLDVDTVTFRLPDGYTVETLPRETRLTASFGTFHAKTVGHGDSLLVYTRTLELSTAMVPAASYAEYRKFFADIVKADRAQAVLVRKGGSPGF